MPYDDAAVLYRPDRIAQYRGRLQHTSACFAAAILITAAFVSWRTGAAQVRGVLDGGDPLQGLPEDQAQHPQAQAFLSSVPQDVGGCSCEGAG